MSSGRVLGGAAALMSVLGLAGPAAAQDAPAPAATPVAAPAPEPTPAPAAAPPEATPPAGPDAMAPPGAGRVGPREWEIGVSVFGLGNGSFFTEPSTADKGGLFYPGFGGAGGGGGLDVSGAWRGILGLDLGFYISSDTGQGSLNDYEFTIGQTAMHIPIRVRVQLPSERGVRPYLFGGPDITVPLGDAEVSNIDPTLKSAIAAGNATKLGAKASTYVAWTVGLGFDFLIPIDGQDFRIPLTIRANLNPGVGAKAEDRLEKPISQENYVFNTEWEIQAVATLGFAWYFY